MNVQCSHTKTLPLDQIIENPKNPNKHPDRQIELLAKIIDYQGQRSPIVISERSGFVVKGHGRLAAIRKLGWETAAVDLQSYDSEAQEYADMVADNKIAELAKHDDGFMIDTIKELELEDMDFELLGMESFELPLDPDEAKDAIEDDVPTDVETRVKPGDLWILGEHRLLCGDSTNIQHVERLMGGEKADMVFTDPPYNANIKEIQNDSFKSIDDFIKFTNEWYSLANSCLKGNASIYVWSFWKTVCEIKTMVFNEYPELEFKNLLIWSKPSLKASSNYYKRSYETCLFYTKGSPIFNPQNADTVRKSTSERWSAYADSDGWYDPKGNGKKSNINFHVATDIWEDIPTMARGGNKEYLGKHPTQKPLKACERGILSSSNASDNILDLFGGSGSTLIACEKTNRKCFMLEIDPHYCSVILDRWEKYSGKTAKLSES